MFNVVVEWWYPVVVRGFYTVVVVVLSVVSNQTRALSSPRDSKKHLPIETNLDHYESVEVANARVPSHPKNIASAFGLFGKQRTGYPHSFFHVLITQGFLGSFGDFFLMTSSALRLIPRVNPAFNPPTV